MLILLLLCALDWNREVAAIEEDFWLDGDNCLMIFDNTGWDPTLLYLGMYRRSRRIGEEWVNNSFPIRIRTAAYDTQNILSVVATPEFGPFDDSLYICFYPDVEDTTNYVTLDSLSDRNSPTISALRFVDGLPMFAYNHGRTYDNGLITATYLKFAWLDGIGNWHIEVLDSARWHITEPSGSFGHPRLELGPDETPYLLSSQNDGSGGSISRIAIKQDEGWVFDTIESTPKMFSTFTETFGIDANGYVHILHAWDYTLFYTTNKSGIWLTDTVDTLPPWASTLPCWMDVAPGGLPRGLVSQINASIDLLSRYYSYDGSMWQMDTCPYTVWFDIDRWGNSHLMGLDTGRHVLPDTVFHYWLDVGIEEELEEAGEIQLSAGVMQGALRVSCSLPYGEHGTITLYDATGRRIERMAVTRSGSVEFNSALASGVYLVRLESKQATVTKKAVVLR